MSPALRFLFSTGSLYTYGIDRCFALAARAGFDGIELMADRRWDTRQPEYLLGLMDRFALPIAAVHVPLESDVLSGWPDDYAGRIVQTVELAQALAAGVVVHHLPPRFLMFWLRGRKARLPVLLPGKEPYSAWLETSYAALQARAGATLCIENMPAVQIAGARWNLSRWNSAEGLARFPCITLDTTHLGTWGLDPLAVYDRLRDRVRHVHLSNFDGKEHRRPEDGRLPLDRLLARLGADGYGGAVTVELAPDALNAGHADEEVAGLMAASLRYCREAVGK